MLTQLLSSLCFVVLQWSVITCHDKQIFEYPCRTEHSSLPIKLLLCVLIVRFREQKLCCIHYFFSASLSLSFPFHLIDVVRGRLLYHNCRLKNSSYVDIFHFRFLITFGFGECHLIVFTARIHLKLSTESQSAPISLAINELASSIVWAKFSHVCSVY